jgi:hypothetical protein
MRRNKKWLMSGGKPAKVCIILLFSVLLFSGCDLFNAKLDEDVAKKIDQAVWEANQPVINVETKAVFELGNGATSGDGGGNIIPSGILSQVKQNIPFRLSHSAISGYGFTGWRARRSSADPGDDPAASWDRNGFTGRDIVEFSPVNPSGSEVMVTVKENPGAGRIIIEGVASDAPVVLGVNYGDSRYGGTPSLTQANAFIQFTFSKPIDHNSFISRPYGQLDPYTNAAASGPYLPPRLTPDGKTLIFQVMAGPTTPYNTNLAGKEFEIHLLPQIQGIDGVYMGQTFLFFYNTPTGANSDMQGTDLPNITDSVMGLKAEIAERPNITWEEIRAIFGNMASSDLSFDRTRTDNWIYLVFKSPPVNRPITRVRIFEKRGDTTCVHNGYNVGLFADVAWAVNEDGNPTGNTLHGISDSDKVLRDKLIRAYADTMGANTPVYVVKYCISPDSQYSEDSEGLGETDIYLFATTQYYASYPVGDPPVTNIIPKTFSGATALDDMYTHLGKGSRYAGKLHEPCKVN